MIYRPTSQSLISASKWVLLTALIAFLAIFFIGSTRAFIGSIVMFLVLNLAPIFLLFQYQKVTYFSSFEIDYENQSISVLKGDLHIRKKISDLKSVQYHRAVVPTIYLSLVLKLCEHFYYYRFEFIDGSIYYLTCLASPDPSFDEKGVFYPYFIKHERIYASIK